MKSWKKAVQFAGILAILALIMWLSGCASCRECRGEDVQWAVATAAIGPPTPSPQTPAPPNDAAPPWRPVRDTFATPPTDGPDPTPGTPTPATPPVAKVPGKARTTTTSEAEGGLVISGNSGTIILNSPGVAPAPQASAATPMVAAYPLIPGPLSDQQVFGLAKRIGGGLAYMLTGNCPAKPATVATGVPVVSASYVAPAASYAMPAASPNVVMMAAPVQQPAQAPMVYVVPVPVAAPMPQPAMAPLPTPGYYLPVASPQSSPPAPRKHFFGCLKKS